MLKEASLSAHSQLVTCRCFKCFAFSTTIVTYKLRPGAHVPDHSEVAADRVMQLMQKLDLPRKAYFI
jgi:hypothetical protein